MDDLVGDAVLVEAEMRLRLLERGVQDGVLDDRLLACKRRPWRRCVRHLPLRRGAFTGEIEFTLRLECVTCP